MYKLYTSSYVYCYLVFYALESAVRPLGERRYTKQPLLLYYYYNMLLFTFMPNFVENGWKTKTVLQKQNPGRTATLKPRFLMCQPISLLKYLVCA